MMRENTFKKERHKMFSLLQEAQKGQSVLLGLAVPTAHALPSRLASYVSFICILLHTQIPARLDGLADAKYACRCRLWIGIQNPGHWSNAAGRQLPLTTQLQYNENHTMV
jgi:hypothetical protein